jgi:alkylhydroperoxidase/carboxymuconolactone decarboxylase family protein YurZ
LPVIDNGAFSTRANTMKLSVKPITSRLYKAWQRAWLRARLDSYTRHLQAIAAQRENDFYAERMLHRAVSATRSKLQSL